MVDELFVFICRLRVYVLRLKESDEVYIELEKEDWHESQTVLIHIQYVPLKCYDIDGFL